MVEVATRSSAPLNGGLGAVSRATRIAMIAGLGSLTLNAASQISAARAELLSKCFFVYAPLYEASAKMQNERLRSYATQRMMYVRGTLDSIKNDPLFKSIFERDLTKNKEAGIRLENAILQAWQSNNSDAYNRALGNAESCDRALGL